MKRPDGYNIPYSSTDIINEFNKFANEYSLCNYMEGIIIKLKQNGKARTAETYTAALNSFRRFLDDATRQGRINNVDDDITLDCLSSVRTSTTTLKKSNGRIPSLSSSRSMR